jgi:energy-converting hydrogenase B subunit Q
MADEKLGLVIIAANVPGVLHQVTGVIAKHAGDIRSISIIEELRNEARTYFELDLPGEPGQLVADLDALDVVRSVTTVQSLQKI